MAGMAQCPVCEDEFAPMHSEHLYCGVECRKTADQQRWRDHKKPGERRCDQCQRRMTKRRNRRFCSQDCAAAWRKAAPRRASKVHRFVVAYNERKKVSDIARDHGVSRQRVSWIVCKARRAGLTFDAQPRVAV